MAFRIKAAARGLAALVFVAAPAFTQPFTFAVRHGTLTFTAAGVRYDDSRAKKDRSWSRDYGNIQQLSLSPTEIRLRTYDDVRWQLGRDREYVFQHLAPGETAKLYPFLSARLDRRFVARLPEPVSAPEWEVPAKMLRRTSGYNGVLKIGADRIVFEAAGEHASRTWRYTDLASVSSSGLYQLSFTSLDGETRFQLKEALSEDRYNDLWRRVMDVNGLQAFQSSGSHH